MIKYFSLVVIVAISCTFAGCEAVWGYMHAPPSRIVKDGGHCQTNYVVGGIYRTRRPMLLSDQDYAGLLPKLMLIPEGPHLPTVEQYQRDGEWRWWGIKAGLPAGTKLVFREMRVIDNCELGEIAYALVLIVGMNEKGLVDASRVSTGGLGGVMVDPANLELVVEPGSSGERSDGRGKTP